MVTDKGENTMNPELMATLSQAGQAIISSPALEGLLGALVATLFLRRDSKVKAFEEIKGKNFAVITQKLLDEGKMSYFEYYKCKNFYQVAQKADSYIQEIKNNTEESAEPEENKEYMDFDWFMRFFDSVGTISNEDLQDLWSKVLASEVSKPKTCSLRTLDMIRNMSAEEAKTFQELSKFIILSGDIAYMDATGFYDSDNGHTECHDYIQNLGLKYSQHIVPMIEAGVFSSTQDIAIYLGKGREPLMVCNQQFYCVIKGLEEEPKLFQQDSYILTSCGKELYRLLRTFPNFAVDTEYSRLCFKELQECNPFVKIDMYIKKNDDQLVQVL